MYIIIGSVVSFIFLCIVVTLIFFEIKGLDDLIGLEFDEGNDWGDKLTFTIIGMVFSLVAFLVWPIVLAIGLILLLDKFIFKFKPRDYDD